MPVILARDQQSIYVRVCGRGTPVLMLHGVGMDSRHWLPFVYPLSHRFRFYMPDFRGAGRSSRALVNKPDLFVNLAEDVQDIINHFALNDFILVGYSLGASTALHLMHEGGFTQVRRYLHIDQSPTLANPADGYHGLMGRCQPAFFDTLQQLHALLEKYSNIDQFDKLPAQARAQAAILLTDVLAVAAGQPQIEFMLKKLGRLPRLLSLLVRNIRLATLRSYLLGYFNNSHDYRDTLRNCDTPMTFFIGKQSVLYDYQGQQAMAKLAKHSNAICFEHAGHLVQLDEPLRFAQEFRRFLLASV